MKYPSAFVLSTQAPTPQERQPKSVPVDRCEKCMGTLVNRTTVDSLQTGKREDDVNGWTFSETSNRTNCNCVKVRLYYCGCDDS